MGPTRAPTSRTSAAAKLYAVVMILQAACSHNDCEPAKGEGDGSDGKERWKAEHIAAASGPADGGRNGEQGCQPHGNQHHGPYGSLAQAPVHTL